MKAHSGPEFRALRAWPSGLVAALGASGLRIPQPDTPGFGDGQREAFLVAVSVGRLVDRGPSLSGHAGSGPFEGLLSFGPVAATVFAVDGPGVYGRPASLGTLLQVL